MSTTSASVDISGAGKLISTLRRYQTLYTHRITSLPIAILMPHSACNCRCVMCDIWKGNNNKKQLNVEDVSAILVSLKKLGTRRVLMSGGEALLNPDFFRFCEILKESGIKVTLLSTGITLERHALQVSELVDEVIVSLDGDEPAHNAIRNIPNAYSQLRAGVVALKKNNRHMPVRGRSVIHKLNYKVWSGIVKGAKEMGLDSISFLPADVTSEAFNREQTWDRERQDSVLVPFEELPVLDLVLDKFIAEHNQDIQRGFVVEGIEKLKRISQYYKASHGLGEFPYKKCNAPWTSAVVEADGSVRPCFFHDVIGNVRDQPLHELLNTRSSINYRRNLDVMTNETCKRCVCYLNLQPRNHSY